MVKSLLANAGDLRDVGSIPGSGRSSGEGNGKLVQYSCLGNPMDRGAEWATVLGVARVRHNRAHTHKLPQHSGCSLVMLFPTTALPKLREGLI